MPVTNREFSSSLHPDSRSPVHVPSVRSDFYREELRKHWHCLEQQREHYSHKTMIELEAALRKLMEHVDRLCSDENGDEVVSRLLRQIDGVTQLSASADRQPTH
jgi:hypothetical protein